MSLTFPLSEVKKVFNKWLYLEDDRIIDVALATAVANRFPGDPLWVLIVGAPSNSKTEVLRSFEGHNDCFFLSSLTARTLVSGKETKADKDPSLLPKLNDKLLIIKDFTSILSLRADEQREIMGQFREIADGKYDRSWGVGKEFHWTGHVGFLGAVTPYYDACYSAIAQMGERFLLYRVHNKDNHKMARIAQLNVSREVEMRAEIAKAVHRFIDQFKTGTGFECQEDKDVEAKIIHLACFCALCRTHVSRDGYTRQFVQYVPEPEGTPRLVKQFMMMGIALAMVYGKPGIDAEVYEVLKKIGLDLLSVQRKRLIRHLWTSGYIAGGGWATTNDIAEGVNMPGKSTLLTLEDFMILGIAGRDKDEGEEDEDVKQGRKPYKWQLTPTVCDYITGSEVFAKDDGFEIKDVDRVPF